MSVQGIDQMLGELRAMSDRAAGKIQQADAAAPADFAGMLQSSLNQVSQNQQASEDLQRAFSTEDPNVNLQDVVVSLQKASLSFQTMVQVRNKLVSAYQEIMNMQV